MKQKVFLFAINLLTLSRFPLGILFYRQTLIQQDRTLWCMVLFFCVAFSDWLDGKLARKYQMTTHTGAALDVLADFFFIIISHLGLYQLEVIPVWTLFLISFKFIEFLITSHIFPKIQKKGHLLWFDKLGKRLAIALYLFPIVAVGLLDILRLENAKILFTLAWFLLLLITVLSVGQRVWLSLQSRKQES